MKDSFIFYTAYAEKFKRLSDMQFGQFVRALISYQETEEVPEIEDPAVGMAFDVAKIEIDAANEKYFAACEQRREAGKRSAAVRSQNKRPPTKSNETQRESTNGNETQRESTNGNYNDNDNDNDNDIYIKTIDHRSGDRVAEDQPKIVTLTEKRFEEFWTLYPRKVGKLKAYQSFKKINPNAELFAKIMDALQDNLDNNANWRRDNGQYIPHPTTWLNQGRWDDVIANTGTGATNFFERALRGEVDY